MTTFDRVTLRVLREEIDAALKAVADKHGISLTLGKITFAGDGSTMSGKIEGAVARDGQVQTKEAVDFLKYAEVYGLKAEDLGRQFVSKGRWFEITGLRPKAPKRPVLARGVADGQTYVFPVEMIKAARFVGSVNR